VPVTVTRVHSWLFEYDVRVGSSLVSGTGFESKFWEIRAFAAAASLLRASCQLERNPQAIAKAIAKAR